MGIFTKGINPRAFAAPLKCPHPHPKYPTERCDSQKWKLDKERSSPIRLRYICKQCGKGLIYDISNNINPELLRVRK